MSRVETCEKCGSVYHLTGTHVPFRDKDSIDCDVCGTKLFSWNGSTMWEAVLKVRNQNHLNRVD